MLASLNANSTYAISNDEWIPCCWKELTTDYDKIVIDTKQTIEIEII